MQGKEVTIYDIAEKLKISGATVSRALNDDPVVTKKTRQKIMKMAEEMGYRPNLFARNLREGKTNTLGIMIPRINSYFMSSVISGMEQVANNAGYNLIISQSGESDAKEKENLKTLFHSRIDGLMVSLAYDTRDLSNFDSFLKRKIPVIFYDRVIPDLKSMNIVIDNRRRAYEATSHLVEQGCKRIVFLSAILKRNVYVDRYQGYLDALHENQLTSRADDLIITDLNRQGGLEAASRVLNMDPRPDGIFAANDECGVGCMIGLKQAGINIPEDIAVVGFNNDPVSTVIEPNLTTVDYPGFELGETAARTMIDHLDGKANVYTANTIIIRSSLLIRNSSLRTKKT